jgi:transposase
MAFRSISQDLKERAIWMWQHGYITRRVARLLGVSTRSVQRWAHNDRVHGSVILPYLHTRGRPPLLTGMQVDEMVDLVKEAPFLYLQEIADWLAIAHNIGLARSTLSDSLRNAGLMLKRLRKCTAERDPVKRQVFCDQVQAHILARQIVCVDETSKDNCTLYRVHGRAPSGQRAILNAPFRRGKRYSIVAALGLDGYVAQRVVEGSVDGEEFFDFIVEEGVRNDFLLIPLHLLTLLQLPQMQPWPADRSVIVMDNCAIHKSDALREVIEAHGTCAIYHGASYTDTYSQVAVSSLSLHTHPT